MSLNKKQYGRTTKQNKKAWYTKVISCIKQAAGAVASGIKQAIRKVIVSVVRAWTGAEKEARHWLAIVSAAGVLLLVAVIILSVRLHGVSKELETAQAMSVSLQTELDSVMESVKQGEMQPAETTTPAVTTAPVQTGTSIPTTGPMPTIAEDRHIVCIDAGHGDWDGGAVLQDGNGNEIRVESEDTLWMAQQLRDALKAYDVDVVMTRETDVFLELTERTDIANAADADVLISFHRNSFASEDDSLYNDVSGTEIWVHNSKPAGAVELAGLLLDAVESVGGMKNRGVKYGTMTGKNENYAINRYANMTSMIIEFGFVTNASDNAAYDANGQAYTKEMAKVIYEWLEAQE